MQVEWPVLKARETRWAGAWSVFAWEEVLEKLVAFISEYTSIGSDCRFVVLSVAPSGV